MSYLLVTVIGVIAGWLVGQNLKGNEHGVVVDLAGGAIGAIVVVILSRLVGPAALDGYLMSTVLSIVGAIAAVVAARQIFKPKPVPVRARGRR